MSGLLFGPIPVLKYAGPQIAGALRGGGRNASASRARHRSQDTLVVVQVALALVLLVNSGLMIRSFRALRSVDPGFTRAGEVQTVRISIPALQVQEPERVTRMQQDILDKLAAIPGVTSAAFASSMPMEKGFTSSDGVYVEGRTYALGQTPIRRFKFVSPGFLKTVGTRLIAGRDLTWADIYGGRPVAMVSENVARELWRQPGVALGKRIRNTTTGPWREIVGVTGDVRDNGVDQDAPKMVYWPSMMNSVQVTRSAAFAIRSERAGTESFLKQVHEAVWSVNANLPLALIRTQQANYDQSLARTSFTMVMLAIAGSMALALGVIGIYGVFSYAVSQRNREIGIRLALGAQRGELQLMFVRHGLVLASIGVAIGLGAAVALTRLMASLLFGIGPLDPVTYVAVPIILVVAAGLASYLPACRAAAVDPVEALKAE